LNENSLKIKTNVIKISYLNYLIYIKSAFRIKIINRLDLLI